MAEKLVDKEIFLDAEKDDLDYLTVCGMIYPSGDKFKVTTQFLKILFKSYNETSEEEMKLFEDADVKKVFSEIIKENNLKDSEEIERAKKTMLVHLKIAEKLENEKIFESVAEVVNKLLEE